MYIHQTDVYVRVSVCGCARVCVCVKIKLMEAEYAPLLLFSNELPK